LSTPRLIVFDVDGTLIDSQLVIIKAMATAYRAVGLPVPSDAQTLSIVGLSLPEAMRGISPEIDEATVDALVKAYRETFVEQRKSGHGEAAVPLYQGARACLLRLKESPFHVLGAATGKARRGLDVVIETHNLGGLFTTLQTADLHPSKPHPSMLEAACAETGIDPEHAVMIGDTSFDMEMGKAAGFSTIGVAWGYHELDRLGVHADRTVHHFDEVGPTIDALLGAV